MQRDIEAARVQIEAALALLNAHPDREEMASQVNALRSQLSQLDGLRMEASTGNMMQLSALQVGVTVSIGAVQNLTAHVASAAAVESFQSVMMMNHEQMAAREQTHWRQSEQFQQFESDMFTRLDALAAANGMDASAYHQRQRQLEAEYEAAKARGDLAGMLEADALRATNLRIGLEEAGASEAEIRKAREQEEATERSYLQQTAIEARREAEQQGMSVDAVSSHVAGAVAQADAGLEERKENYADRNAARFQASFEKPGFEVAEATEAAPPLSTPNDQKSAVVQL